MEYTGFVYIWYDRKRKWYCIGSHMGAVDDGYRSSTGHFINAHNKRPKDFRRRILHKHQGDHKSLLLEEQRWLDMIDITHLQTAENMKNKTTRYYNRKNTARGLSGVIASDLRKAFYKTDRGKDWLKILAEKFRTNNPSKKGNIPWNKGQKCPTISNGKKSKQVKYTEEHKTNLSKQMKERWSAGVYDNRPMPTPEQIEARRQASLALNRKQTDYQKSQAAKALAKQYIVTHPDGHEEHVTNLSAFSKLHGLDQASMVSCASGRGKSVKKFKVRKVS